MFRYDPKEVEAWWTGQEQGEKGEAAGMNFDILTCDTNDTSTSIRPPGIISKLIKSPFDPLSSHVNMVVHSTGEFAEENVKVAA